MERLQKLIRAAREEKAFRIRKGDYGDAADERRALLEDRIRLVDVKREDADEAEPEPEPEPDPSPEPEPEPEPKKKQKKGFGLF